MGSEFLKGIKSKYLDFDISIQNVNDDNTSGLNGILYSNDDDNDDDDDMPFAQSRPAGKGGNLKEKNECIRYACT